MDQREIWYEHTGVRFIEAFTFVFAHMISGIHRLFEGQGRKEGHFSNRFGSQEGTLARVFATQEAS